MNDKNMTILDKDHQIGRIWTAAALIMMVMIPVFTGIIVGSAPDWKTFFKVFIPLAIIYLPTAIGEVVVFSPMIGANGCYLSFITGNLSNLKVPCAVNAVNRTGAKAGTEEAEVIGVIAIAVSTIVTTLIIGIGVFILAISGLTEFLRSPKAAFLSDAFGIVAFALFGALGGQYLVKYPKMAVLPLVGIVAICVAMIFLGLGNNASTSVMLFVGIIFCYLNARRLYYKKCKAEAAEAAVAMSAEPEIKDSETNE